MKYQVKDLHGSTYEFDRDHHKIRRLGVAFMARQAVLDAGGTDRETPLSLIHDALAESAKEGIAYHQDFDLSVRLALQAAMIWQYRDWDAQTARSIEAAASASIKLARHRRNRRG